MLGRSARRHLLRTTDGSCAVHAAMPPMILFYSGDDERPIERKLREQRARQVCRNCAVTTHCLAYALEIEEPDGMWGGMSENERQRIRPRISAPGLATG